MNNTTNYKQTANNVTSPSKDVKNSGKKDSKKTEKKKIVIRFFA